MTSHDVVARVRRLAGTRKVGHAGTLDPMATGVLVLGVNRATRLLGHLMLTDKAYDATIRLGVATTTDDAEGEVTATASTDGLDEAAVRSAAAEFVGDIEQVPTAVSAIKVDGKRAYQRVRDGEEVELKARPVTVHELVVHDVRAAGEALDVDVSVRCSSGTYIRAIARDLGARLGRRRAPDRAAAYRRRAVRPGRARTRSTSSPRSSRCSRSRTPRGPRSRRRPRRGAGDRRPVRPRARPRPGRADRGLRAGRRVPGPLRAARRSSPGPSPSSPADRLSVGCARADLAFPRRGPGRPRPDRRGHRQLRRRAPRPPARRRPRPGDRRPSVA